MIVLDTDMLSALMRAEPEPAILRWLDRQPGESVWLTSVTVFETRFGLALLPSGRRRTTLERAFERVLADDLSNHVLAAAAAAEAARLAACGTARRPGRRLAGYAHRRYRPRTPSDRRHAQHHALRGPRRPGGQPLEP